MATLTKIGGNIASVGSFESHRKPHLMLDGDPSTFWHTRFVDGDDKPPHYVVLQVPAGTRVAGLTYTAWTGRSGNGHVKEYTIRVSDDGKDWGEPILSGTLKTGVSRVQGILFPTVSTKPFVEFKVTASRSPDGRFLAAIGELDVLLSKQAERSCGHVVGRLMMSAVAPVTRSASVPYRIATIRWWISTC
jgi:hypothetical protein